MPIESPSIHDKITEREREILVLIAAHHTNKEIAESLHLALSTVKWYTKQIFNKLTVNNRREAINQATALGLLETKSPNTVIPNNIPVPLTPFVGRTREVGQLTQLLTKGETRLVTLHGAGGNGKTRLAIRAASVLVEAGAGQFPDGIWFVSLVTLSSPDAIPQFIARTLGHSFLDREMEPIRQLTNYLQKRRLLLILDNFEHLITTEGIKIITEMITQALHVKLLVTSRSRLKVYGEQIFQITGMQTPQEEIDEDLDWKNFNAIELFLQCARRIQQTFEINEENLASITQICQLVDGMPLGIELAATWIEVLSPTEIAEKIKCSLDFLQTNQAGLPERQSSIRAVFDSSWELLTNEERQTFLRLCVVVGDFSHEAAQKITGSSFTTLMGLANKSWLQQAGSGKFQLHDLMRQLGVEILQADPMAWQATKDNHAAYYADFVAEQSLKMRSPDQITGLIAIDDEFDSNITAAWDWLISQNRWDTVIQKMIQGLYHFATIVERMGNIFSWLREARLKIVKSHMGRIEQLGFAVLGTLEVHLEVESAAFDDSSRVRLKEIWKIVAEHHLAEEMGFWYVMLAGLVHAKNLDSGAKESLDEAIARMRTGGDLWALGMSLVIQANWWLEFNFDEDKLLEASQIFSELKIPYEQSFVADILVGLALQNRRDPTEIKDYIERSHQFYKELSALNPKFNYLIYISSGPDSYFQIGEFEKGFAVYHEQQAFFERSGYTGWAWLHSLTWESLHASRYSSYDHARKTRERSLEVAKESGIQSFIAWNIYELGEVYRVFGSQPKALELYRQAHLGFDKLKVSLGLGYCHRAFGDIAIQNFQYADALEEHHKFLNYAVDDNHLWSISQAHGKLALAYAYLKNLEQSRSELQITLNQMRDWGNQTDLMLNTLLAEPVCLINQGKFDEAVSLLWFILSHRLGWNETKRHARLLLGEASSPLSSKEIEKAKKRGEKMVLEEVIKKHI